MWQRRLNLPLAAAALACLCAAARAQTSVSVYAGTSFTRHSDLHIRQPGTGSDATFRGVSWAARPFAQAPYYGYRLTHYFADSPRFGFSLDYTHYKVYARTDRTARVSGVWNGAPVNEPSRIDARVQDFNISHGVNMVSGNLLYRRARRAAANVPESRLQPYAGAGLVFYVPHSESTINHLTTGGRYQSSGLGYQVLGGLSYELNGRVSLFAEAKFNGGTAKVDTAGQGRAETKLRTLHTLAGVSYRF